MGRAFVQKSTLVFLRIQIGKAAGVNAWWPDGWSAGSVCLVLENAAKRYLEGLLGVSQQQERRGACCCPVIGTTLSGGGRQLQEVCDADHSLSLGWYHGDHLPVHFLVTCLSLEARGLLRLALILNLTVSFVVLSLMWIKTPHLLNKKGAFFLWPVFF